jgi:hypothetical protein
MSDSDERKARKFTECGADMPLAAAHVGSDCRILIPPSGGSNPPAPATHSRNWETSPYAAQSRDRRNRAGRGGFERPVSNADFPISGICQRARETRSRRLACGRFNGAERRRDPRVCAVSLLRQGWRRAGSAEAELLSLFGQGSGRFRVSRVTVMSAGARPSAMA